MPKYLIQASYTAQGLAGLIKSPEDRAAAITPMIEGAGGKLDCLYFAFGDYDVVLIADLPDDASMAALAMLAGSSGAITNFKTTVLIPASDGVEAARKAGSLTYRPPGG